MKRVINYGKGENKFHPFVVWRGIHGVWLVHNNNYCTPPSWWTIIGRKVMIVFLIACLSLIGCWWLSTQTPYCFQSVHFSVCRFLDSHHCSINHQNNRGRSVRVGHYRYQRWWVTYAEDDARGGRQPGELPWKLIPRHNSWHSSTAGSFCFPCLKRGCWVSGIGFEGYPLFVCGLTGDLVAPYANILNLTIQWYCCWIYLPLHGQIFNPMPSTGWICLPWSWNQLFHAFYLTSVTDSLSSYIPCGKASSIWSITITVLSKGHNFVEIGLALSTQYRNL